MQEIKKNEKNRIEFKVTYCTSPSWELMLETVLKPKKG